jgi:hypothetical protein
MNITLMVDITEHYANASVIFDAQTHDHHVPDRSDNGGTNACEYIFRGHPVYIHIHVTYSERFPR